jgi:hypothetical protein
MKTKFSSFYIVFLFVIFSTHVYAQPDENNSNKKFSVGINFSPDYAYSILKSPETGEVEKDDREYPRFGFTSGIVAKYKFLTRLTLESGLQFSNKGYNLKVSEQKKETYSYGYNQLYNPSILIEATAKVQYYYLGIPLKINYYLVQKKFNLYVSFGASADYYLDAKAKDVIEYSDRTEILRNNIYNFGLNKFNFVGLAGFGVESSLSKKLKIRIEPVFRYSFTPVAEIYKNEYLHSVGLNFVLFYH